MIFDEKELVAQLHNSALTFSTLPESVTAPPTFSNTAVSPLAGRRAKIHDTPVERARGALYFSDIGGFLFLSFIFKSFYQFFFRISLVPVFDARQVTEITNMEFEKLDKTFPSFNGEIPIGSCVAVGHSVSTYIGKKEDEERLGTSVHLATNVLFVIIFGIPPI